MNIRPSLPASALQEADLLASSVWRFLGPGESDDPQADESYVAPEAQPPGRGQFGSFLVAAQYELSNGALLPGLVQVDVLGTRMEFTPVQIFAAGKGVDPLGRDTETRLRRLLKTSAAQPLRWRLGVLLRGEQQSRNEEIAPPGFLQALRLLVRLLRLKLLR